MARLVNAVAAGFAMLALGGPAAAAAGPCGITWSGGDGRWAVAANWDLGRVPGAADTACVAGGVVTVDGPATARAVVTTGTAQLTVGAAGSLALTGAAAGEASTIGGEGLTVNGGAVAVGAAGLSVDGLLSLADAAQLVVDGVLTGGPAARLTKSFGAGTATISAPSLAITQVEVRAGTLVLDLPTAADWAAIDGARFVGEAAVGGTGVLRLPPFAGPSPLREIAGGLQLDGAEARIATSAGVDLRPTIRQVRGELLLRGVELQLDGPCDFHVDGGSLLLEQGAELACDGEIAIEHGGEVGGEPVGEGARLQAGTGSRVVVDTEGALHGTVSAWPRLVIGQGLLSPVSIAASPEPLAASTGALELGAASVLEAEVYGPADSDRLAVLGPATLGGRLDLFVAPGYVPAAGDEYAILAFASRTGTFASVTGTTILDGQGNPTPLRFEVAYADQGVRLRVIDRSAPAVVPPSETPPVTPSTIPSRGPRPPAVPRTPHVPAVQPAAVPVVSRGPRSPLAARLRSGALRVSVQYPLSQACVAPCRARVELRLRTGRQLYDAVLPGDGKVLLTKVNVRLKPGTNALQLVVPKAVLRGLRWTPAGRFRTLKVRLRVVLPRPDPPPSTGVTSTVTVRDMVLRVARPS